MFYEVILAKNGIKGPLTYASDSPLAPGQIIEAPIMRTASPAVVIKKVAQPDFSCKPIKKILYSQPLPPHLLKVADFIASYYNAPISSVYATILPAGLSKSRRKTPQIPAPTASNFAKIALNTPQKIALEALQTAPGATKLLFGITGSGKTNIYLKMAENALRAQKSVILLVPEIALTSQLVQVFRHTFGENITLLHSQQTEAERHLLFEQILYSDSPQIIIGPRSALFAPLRDLGLIIIDEEHESAYYQDKTPHYSAIRVASFIAKTTKIPCVLGSATPSVCDYHLAKTRNSLVSLTKKAKSTAIAPSIKVIDFKNRAEFSKNRYFSNSLLASIKTNLENHHQTLIFHNRRGSSPLTICDHCGTELVCPTCFLPLTLHADSYTMNCHTCNFSMPVPTNCPNCGASGLIHKGFGTKLLESELSHLFPKAHIRRFDADNKKSETLSAAYDAVKSGEVDILIGTQTLAKGLDLPHLATVGIVQADSGLSLPDFSAEERTFQLLTQVIGRVGRGHIAKAEVIIQTFRPDHPVINYAIHENYPDFATHLLNHLRAGNFPPFTFILKLEISMKTEKSAINKVRTLQKSLSSDPDLIISPPMPAFHERTASGYSWQIIIRAKSRKKLTDLLPTLDKNFRATLDPPSLL